MTSIRKDWIRSAIASGSAKSKLGFSAIALGLALVAFGRRRQRGRG